MQREWEIGDTAYLKEPIASYPISKLTAGGVYGPRGGERYRFEFNFTDAEEAMTAFDNLIAGRNELRDFKDKIDSPKYADCV